MQMSGERTIAADRATVWAALNDPEVLKACIPGCQEMTKTSPTEFEAKVTQKVGPVKATFTGAVELTDIVEGESYRISGKGKGGAAGGASGGAAVRLEDVAEGTKLSYDVDARVTGKLAQLGSRLIDGFAKKMADDFFDRFKGEVEGPQAGSDPEDGSGGDEGGDEDEEDEQAAASAGSEVGADDADAAPTRRVEREARGEAAAERPPTAGAPVANRGAARAHDTAAGTVESELTRNGVAPREQKKSWWSRLFG